MEKSDRILQPLVYLAIIFRSCVLVTSICERNVMKVLEENQVIIDLQILSGFF